MGEAVQLTDLLRVEDRGRFLPMDERFVDALVETLPKAADGKTLGPISKEQLLEYLHDVETRVESATGGQKGKKLTQLGALDPAALIVLARVAGMGANKYAAFNYLKGYDWSLSFNAMMRHALLFWSGEDVDPESGQPHVAHAAWMALCLVSFWLRQIGTDDRFVQP